MSVKISAVIKVGGSLARESGLRERLRTLRGLAAHEPVLVVPGGGPFTDAVRTMTLRHGLGESATHWMSILAMDQYAALLTDVLETAQLVDSPRAIDRALVARRLPVLAPWRWLAREDPLPHSATVTADSIAAWVARRLGIARLVLLKSAPDRCGVDDYFPVAAAGLEYEILVPVASGWRRIA